MTELAQQEQFYRLLGESIRNWRKRRTLSQDSLASLVGLSRTSLTNIENGRQHPSLHVFCNIAERLNVEVSDLLPKTQREDRSVDIGVLAEGLVRGKKELAFIERAITGRKVHGSPQTKNSGASRKSS